MIFRMQSSYLSRLEILVAEVAPNLAVKCWMWFVPFCLIFVHINFSSNLFKFILVMIYMHVKDREREVLSNYDRDTEQASGVV